MQKILSNEEVVEHLMEILDLPSQNALALELDVSRQSLWKYSSSDRIDINNKIITALIEYYRD